MIQANNRPKSKIAGKRPTAVYAVVALAILLSAAAAVQLFPGGTEDSEAADHVVNLSGPSSVPGVDWNGTNTLTFNAAANGYTYMLTGVRSSTINIVFQTDAITTVTLNNVTMTGRITLQGNADVTLLLEGTNKITGSIIIPSTATATAAITIDSANDPGSSDGSLTVIPNGSSSDHIAGIGGQGDGSAASAPNRNAGTITINGGTVTATGSYYGAGIGGGRNGAGGNIIINGGTVTAKGGNNSAGIGGGASGAGGNITINSGTVVATGGGNSTNGAAGIGGGDFGVGGTVTINGGTVTATGSNNAAGIGGGYNAAGGIITITDGTVVATGGSGSNSGGAGIGGGSNRDGNTTTVTGGTVTAIGGMHSAGIGGGINGAGGTVNINSGTVTATGGGNAAGIGGGAGTAGGTTTITGGTVTATGGNGYYGGAGIGGGGQNGAGGTISITGGTVTAIGGTLGAGIGGANDSRGATLTIGSGAEIKAYSKASLPAIYAASVTAASTGYYVNAYFSSPISTTKTTTMVIFAKDGPPASVGTLSLPAAYKCFATHIPGSVYPEDFNIYIVETGGLRQVLRNDNSSPDISSGRSTGTTSLLVKSVSIVSSAMQEKFVDRNNPSAPLQSDTFTYMGPSGGMYSMTFPYFSGYVPIGYKLDSAPTGPTDYLPGDPAGITVHENSTGIIYLVYTELVWRDIDLANSDGSLMNTGWSSYYTCSGGTLTILKDPPEIGERYRIHQTGPHSVTNIFVNAGVTLPIALANIDITGQIKLNNNADVVLLLEGDVIVTGNIIVPSTAAVTIDSASYPGSSEGSLTVTPNGVSSNGLAGIGGAGTVTINGGIVTAVGGIGAAGIGGIGANVSIGSGAEIKAYSDGTVPAIYSSSIAGTGYYVNAVLTNTISEALLVYASDDAYNPLAALELPAGYKGFAFQISGSASWSNYNIYSETAGQGVLRVHDSSALIYSVNSLNGYDIHAGTYGALPVKLGALVEITLEAAVSNGTLPTDVTFTYTDGGTPQKYTAPFYVAETSFLTVTVSVPAGYEFLRWHDSSNIIGASAMAQTIDVTAYSLAGSATITVAFAVSGNRITVTLDSDPDGALLEYAIGTFNPQTYTGPFWMDRSEILMVGAETTHTFPSDVFSRSFLRWESSSGMIWNTATISNMTMPLSPAVTVGYTAVYPDPGDILVIDLTQTGGASAALTYTVNSVPFTYTGIPFTILKTDNFAITASNYGTHQFMRWYDSDGHIVSNTATTGSLNLSGYGTSITFVAYFVDPASTATLTLSSYPALSGAFQYRLYGTLSWIGYGGPVTLNAGDRVEIHATAIPGYSFRFWGDDTAELDIRTVLVNTNTTLTAFFLSDNSADRVEITITPSPAGTGTFYWQLPGMTMPMVCTAPFEINKTDNLTIIVAAEAGYIFRMWDDSSLLATRHVGTHTDDTEYIAFFLSDNPANRVTLTLNSYPASAGTFQYRFDINASWIGYSDPVIMNIGDIVYVRVMGVSGYSFRFWDDPAETNTERTYIVSVNTKLTAFFLSDNSAGRVEITLTPSPAGMGTLSWQLPGMTVPMVCTAPFEVNKTDNLTIIAAAEPGYIFRMWDDSSMLAARHVGTHTDDTEYIAFFISNNPLDWVTLTLNSYPASAGTFQYRFDINASWIGYRGPVVMNKYDEVYVRTTEASGYSFRFWDDPAETNAERTYIVSVNTKLTAFFLSDDPAKRVFIDLVSDPANTGTFSWQLPGMTMPMETTTFEINKTDNLTIIAAAEPGYIFQMWDDSSIEATRHVGPHAASTTYIAFFLSDNPANRVTLTLNSYPALAGTFQYKLNIAAPWIGYSGPVVLNKDDEVYVRTIEASGYSFRFWDDPAETNVERTYIVSTNTTLTAFFLSDDPVKKITITLTSSPVGAGTFSWQLPGMTAPMESATFEINKTDNLTVIAAAEPGYIFRMWDDSSLLATRHVGTHTVSTAYTAFFLSDNPLDWVTLTLNSYPASAGTFQYRFDINASWIGYSDPVIMNIGDTVYLHVMEVSGYNFRFWDDPAEINAERTLIVGADITLTAFFLAAAASDKVTITLTSSPFGAGTFSWQLPGMTIPMESATFEINKTDDLTIIEAAAAGFTFRMWDDSSTAMMRHVGTHTANTEYTAFFLGTDTITLTLNSYPASSGAFQYNLKDTVSWIGYSEPVVLNRYDEVYIRAITASGYNFRFWGDDLAETNPRAVLMDADTAFTAFFLATAASDRVTITLTSSPASGGTFSWQLPGMDTPAEDTIFEVNKTDDLTIIVTQSMGYTFRMWDDSSTATIRHVGTHAASTEYTAFFLSNDPLDKVTITLTSSPGAGGMLAWSLPQMTAQIPYTAPFEVNITDDLTIMAAAAAGYTFQMWDDSTWFMVRHVGTHAASKEYTAFFLSDDPADWVTLTLDSYPALSGAFQYKYNGTVSWIGYSGPVTLNNGDTVDVQTTAASGYSFRFWGDDPLETDTRVVTVNTDTALTAFFLATAASGKVTITLTSSPASAGTFYWQLPGMDAPVESSTFEVNTTDNLTIIAAAATGYTFRFWEDLSALMTRSVGPHAADTEYTAYFLTAEMSDRVLVILSTNITAGAMLGWQLQGMTAPVTYDGPFYINNTDDLTVLAYPALGYTFRFWEDASTDELRPIGIADMGSFGTNGVVTIAEYTAYYLSDVLAERTEITLTSDPTDGGTFLWELSGMTVQKLYDGPFEVNRTDSLTVTAIAESGYIFLMWEDLSETATRNIGTHTMGTAGYTASFKLLPKYYITATAGPNGSIDPAGSNHVVPWTTHTYTFIPDPGFRVSAVYVDGAKISGTPGSYTFPSVVSDHEISVEFDRAQAGSYYITATSDDITSITPKGIVTVAGDANKTFYFSANEGYRIKTVTVDGNPLSLAEIDAGYYTFRNVLANHSIDVTGDREQRTDTVLEIDVIKKGYAEYSVNGGPFQRYVSPVTIHDCIEITLMAYADDGYLFMKWEVSEVYKTPEITLDVIAGTMHVKLYFAEIDGDGGSLLPLVTAAIILLAVSGIAIWWFLILARIRKHDK